MIDFLLQQNPVFLAILGTGFAWIMTGLGASSVFFFKTINPRALNLMLGFAAGVMIAASFWSLLSPAIEMTESAGGIKWLPAVSGFLAGGFSIWWIHRILPHTHFAKDEPEHKKAPKSFSRSFLLSLAITLHNIPEGLSVGVAFGVLWTQPSAEALLGAMALAMGIGIQNIPEGAAIAIPLRREGFSRWKAFQYGQLSGLVEVFGGILGVWLISLMTPILPYALSFSAGAMIFVVIQELIPESQNGKNTELSTIGALLGFALMMFLDVALG
jgi:zinc transporter, ZIP family